jgi:cyclophilin family peptidyl-prolyl cis-trans isomerase
VRDGAPRGADRFYELVTGGFYDGARLYRVRPKFVVQWGIHKDPAVQKLWSQLQMPDDPVKQSNRRGYLSFAMRGPSTRTTQVFINLAENGSRLDARGFAPFGHVVAGMDVVDKFYAGYGEVQPLGGGGPDPARMEALGEEYIQRSFPRLDQITSAKVVEFKQ